MAKVTYNTTRPFAGGGRLGVVPRPWADVCLEPAHAMSSTFPCLVDTGADYLILPQNVATRVGLNIAGAQTMRLSVVGGSIAVPYIKNLEVDIEGHVIHTDVVFDPHARTNGLLGRAALLSLFDVGFDAANWYTDL